MANRCKDLPVECWELIFSRLHHKSDLESFSVVSKQFLALTNRLRIGLTVIDSTLLTHGIKHIGKGAELPSLEVISAAGSALNDEGLVMIGSRCSRLLKLNLENCKGVTAEGLHAMVKNCRSLREINLKKCPQVSINSLNNLVFSSSSLRRVIPPCCAAFTDSLKGFYLHHGCRVYSG
uniref:F-box domain-containing protein n=1 Tax=Solanum lycopersicum TaxID=4081 RepID=A0A3Q7FRT6_SOLLC